MEAMIHRMLEAHELQEGESYYILLTNSGGLFRYNIHDVVQCVGFQGQTPLLAFLHKGAHCTNMAGEKLTEYQVATAVREGFGDLNRSVETVMLVPVMGSPPRYVLLVEQHSDDYWRYARRQDRRSSGGLELRVPRPHSHAASSADPYPDRFRPAHGNGCATARSPREVEVRNNTSTRS